MKSTKSGLYPAPFTFANIRGGILEESIFVNREFVQLCGSEMW